MSVSGRMVFILGQAVAVNMVIAVTIVEVYMHAYITLGMNE